MLSGTFRSTCRVASLHIPKVSVFRQRWTERRPRDELTFRAWPVMHCQQVASRPCLLQSQTDSLIPCCSLVASISISGVRHAMQRRTTLFGTHLDIPTERRGGSSLLQHIRLYASSEVSLQCTTGPYRVAADHGKASQTSLQLNVSEDAYEFRGLSSTDESPLTRLHQSGCSLLLCSDIHHVSTKPIRQTTFPLSPASPAS